MTETDRQYVCEREKLERQRPPTRPTKKHIGGGSRDMRNITISFVSNIVSNLKQ
jgi:hypothetical protein